MANEEEPKIIIQDTGPLKVRTVIQPGALIRSETKQVLRPGGKEGELIVESTEVLELFKGGVEVNAQGPAKKGSVGVTRLLSGGGMAVQPALMDFRILFTGEARYTGAESDTERVSKSRIKVGDESLVGEASLDLGNIVQISAAGVVTASLNNQP